MLATLTEIEGKILEYYGLLRSSPRSDPNRVTYLLDLAELRGQREEFSSQKSDLDKAITHLTEAVLLLQTPYLAGVFLHLASLLLSRYLLYKEASYDDLKSSIKYFHFLRTNFHSLEALDIPYKSEEDFSTYLFHALALNLKLTGEMAQDLEEMLALIPEIITADILTRGRQRAIEAFGWAVSTNMYRQQDVQRVFNRAIQVLREAAVLNPDLVIPFSLAMCLAVRFQMTLVMNDCEEAITNLDRIVATCSPGSNLTRMESNAIRLISNLLMSRVNLSPTPGNLEDAIHRLRAFVPYSLDDEQRTWTTGAINQFMRQRSRYFGVTGNFGETPPNPALPSLDKLGIWYMSPELDETILQMQQKLAHIGDLITSILDGETTDVEVAVESGRKLIPLQQASDQWSPSSDLTNYFSNVLVAAYKRTNRVDYLDEAIITCRALHKISVSSKMHHFAMGYKLHDLLTQRFTLFSHMQDFLEIMRLFPGLANDGSGEVYARFEISCLWASMARLSHLPVASIAYETAMSLLQETLVFCPTLQTQHYRLSVAAKSRDGQRFPSNYASYQIGNGQLKQAVETLERGRALIWSEMRGLRTSTDQLRAVDPVIADKFSDINQRLESVAMSVAQSDDAEMGRSKTGRREHPISHLVLMQRKLLEERNSLISNIQSLPGLEDFLNPRSFDFLNSAAACGPVIIISLAPSHFPSYIILLLKDSPPSIISTPSSFFNRAYQLETELLHVRKEKGLDSPDYGFTLASVLSGLYELVGKPVIERLRKLKVPEKSRIWWCPTSVFCSLPLHAMGPIPSDDGNDLYFSDLYIPSYTPTLTALIESRQRGPFSDLSDNSKPSILLVAQPDTLPGAFDEITAIETTITQVTTLISAMATPETVIEGLREHRFAHFVCHGLLEAGKPFDASLELHKADLTLLEIVQSQLPAAEFAFLAACHTAELTEGSVADESLHLSAAMQYCGFRSVVGTMWAMADMDGADLSRHFYKAIFADVADQNSVPYHERSAQALQIAVKKLRKKRGMTLERWVNFVHYGA